MAWRRHVLLLLLSAAVASACAPEPDGTAPATTRGAPPSPPTSVATTSRPPVTSAATAPTADLTRSRTVPDGRYPFQVALLDLTATDDAGRPASSDLGRLSCGGSLLDERHVLTAGHCVVAGEGEAEPLDPVRDLRVVVGRTVLTSNKGVVRRVAAVRVHPDYGNGPTFDVAVVTLDKPVTGARPAALVAAGDSELVRVGRVATFSGWGHLGSVPDGREGGAKGSDRLRAGDVAFIAVSDCAAAYARSGETVDPVVMVCTSTRRRVGHCLGDSGGPLFVESGGRVVQVGVVSWARGCGDPRYPSVWTRLGNGSINRFVRGALSD